MIILEVVAVLGRSQLIQVPLTEPYNLLISAPAWLPDLNIKIWEVINVPQYPIFPVSTSRTSIPQTPSTVTASITAVQIAAARPGRNRLTVYNNSNAHIYIRYAATGAGTSATASAGGYDDLVAAGNVFEYPNIDFPETAINAIWVVPGGGAISGSATISEGIRG
ncbi:hypothetical protein [Argonema antarcticum]|uniref:hypothetical protein n=1 Tax=Argonema antarcticum TaxID=2942763 RepID=UPI002011DE72|nr:hypothetical protein [Argonema antarcticum]